MSEVYDQAISEIVKGAREFQSVLENVTGTYRETTEPFAPQPAEVYCLALAHRVWLEVGEQAVAQRRVLQADQKEVVQQVQEAVRQAVQQQQQQPQHPITLPPHGPHTHHAGPVFAGPGVEIELIKPTPENVAEMLRRTGFPVRLLRAAVRLLGKPEDA